MSRGPLRRAALEVLLCAALAAGHLAAVWGATQRPRAVEWDELGWLVASDTAYRLAFGEGAGGAERWHEGFQLTTYGAMNPNVAKLVMGAALRISGYELAPPPFFPLLGPPNVRYDRLAPRERALLAREHVPYVVTLRWLVLWTSAACAVALFLVGRALGGALLGAAAYVGFVSTPLVERLAFAVYSDKLLLLLMLLSTLAAVRVLRRWSRPPPEGGAARTAAAFAALAALLGATVGTKYNGALVCVAFAAAWALLRAAGRFGHRRAWQNAAAPAATGALAFAVFLALNPQLQGDVPGRVAASAAAWSDLLAKQQAEFQGRALATWGERVAAVYRNAVLATGLFARALPAGAALLTALGLAALAVRFRAALRGRGDAVGLTVLACFVLVVGVGTTLWLPLDWGRYYLPLVPAFCLLQALAVDSFFRLGVGRARDAGLLRPGFRPRQR